MKVLQAAADLGSIELHPLLLEPRHAHVVDMKLEVSSIHDGHHQAQEVFGLVGIGQADL